MTLATRSFLLLLALLPPLALAADASSDAPAAPDVSAPESQQRGRELLMNMARFLAGLDRYAVKVRGGFDAVQDDGTKIQYLETRDVTLQRPRQMRAEELRSDRRASYVLFDGINMTVYDAQANVYAQAAQPGSVDDAVLYFTRELGMRLPLSALLTTRFPEELAQRLQFADYVETAYVFDTPAHHVIGRTALLDFQLWIADGAQPWPQRIVLTYRNERGQPQYFAEFSGWNAKPRIAKNLFEFEPPADAARIVFAVQLANQAQHIGAGAPTGAQP
jgi:hypothetical protein